jgi:hypothetical protein
MHFQLRGVSIPPAYSLAICSNHTLAKAKAKANHDEWPLAGYPVRKAGGDHKFYFEPICWGPAL